MTGPRIVPGWSLRAIRRPALVALGALALGSRPASLPAQGDALTLNEILDLQRRGVPARRIVRNAREYCVSFAVTDSVERELTAAGADTFLIGGIRQSCIVTTPVVKLPDGVLLDDNLNELSGLPSFTAPDRLCTARPDTSGLRMENRRLAVGCAIGYPFDVGPASVRIELTIGDLQGKRGAMAALGFGKASHSWDQYSFGVTNDDRFEVCLSTDGRCRALLAEKRAVATGAVGTPTRVDTIPASRSSETRMAIEIRGREMAFYIGDELVGTHTAAEPPVGSLSLGVGSRSSVVFKRLRVARIAEVAIPE